MDWFIVVSLTLLLVMTVLAHVIFELIIAGMDWVRSRWKETEF